MFVSLRPLWKGCVMFSLRRFIAALVLCAALPTAARAATLKVPTTAQPFIEACKPIHATNGMLHKRVPLDASQQIKVAVFGDNTICSYLNSISGISATLVSADQLETAGFLSQFDTFVFTRDGSSFGSNNLSQNAANNIKSFVTGNVALFMTDLADSIGSDAPEGEDTNAETALINAVNYSVANGGKGYVGELGGAGIALSNNASGDYNGLSLGLLSGTWTGTSGATNYEPFSITQPSSPIVANLPNPWTLHQGSEYVCTTTDINSNLLIAQGPAGSNAPYAIILGGAAGSPTQLLPDTSTAVLLVHGTWSDASTWDAVMLPKLVAAGFTVEAVNFPTEPETLSNETYIELQAKAIGRRIGELITRSGQPSVNLVCHSMGGLAARYYLTHPTYWQNGGTYAGVSKLVLLGTPNLGLDSSILDPIGTMAQARSATEPFSSDNINTVAVDTYDNWSPAVREMFSEWEPAPDDTDSLLDPYPANLVLSQWQKDDQGNYLSPIQGLSYDFAYSVLSLLPSFGSDYNALAGMVDTIPNNNTKFLKHIAYYAQTAHQLGVLYPDASGIWGVQSRRISQFLIDLNNQNDTSGAKVYMMAGTYPLAYAIDSRVLHFHVNGPYTGALINDGIVPEESALGIDPLMQGVSIYPNATRLPVATYHTDLPKNDGVATQVVQWLQDITSSGWTARAVTVGVDGQTRLLWANVDGRAGLWSVDSTNDVSYGPTVGPYVGWTATHIAAGMDGLTRVLWNKPDGSVGLWLLNADNTVASTGTSYGPFDGWAATSMAVGNDNQTRILWANTDGSMSYWTVDTSGNITYSPTYGPYPGWTPQSISVGTDNSVHILWVNDNSSASLWAIDAAGNVSYTPSYGPFAGWFPVGLATGNDNITHLLWNNVNNAASLWNIDSSGGTSLSPVYGPYSGWFATQLAADGDGRVRLLWTNANGEASFWLVDGAGNQSYSPVFGPY